MPMIMIGHFLHHPYPVDRDGWKLVHTMPNYFAPSHSLEHRRERPISKGPKNEMRLLLYILSPKLTLMCYN